MKPKLNSATIPSAIMTLDATPAEKLLLAICIEHPNTGDWRLRRALGITSAGLRKLKRRLIGKKWLIIYLGDTKADMSYKVCVTDPGQPGQPGDGHFVAENGDSDFANKVAPSSPSPDPVNGFVIRAEILEMKDFSASEKFLLTVYANNPAATNEQVMQALGLSRAGVKKARHRLLNVGALTKTGDGNRIHVPGLVYTERPEGGGQYVPENEVAHPEQSTANAVRKVVSVEAVWNERWQLIQSLTKFGNCAPAVLQQVTEQSIKQLMEELPDSPERTRAISLMKQDENLFFAGQFICDHCSRRAKRIEYFKTLGRATSEAVAAFRERVEGAQLAGIAPQRLLGFFGTGRQAGADMDSTG